MRFTTPLELWIKDHGLCPVFELALLQRWGLGGLKWWKANAKSYGYVWDAYWGLWYLS